jgi:hypothetical protein
MYTNIHNFAIPLWPWQWDANYEDNCFAVEDYHAYKVLEQMIKDGDEFRKSKASNPQNQNFGPLQFKKTG